MTQNSQEQNEKPSDKDSETSSSSRQSSPGAQPPQLVGKGGRPKGSRNRITAQKLQIEEALRDQLNLEMPEILLKAVEMAKKGDRAMIKLLVEMTMSKPQAVEDESSGKERVQITVRKLNLSLPKSEPTFIEGTVLNESETEDGRLGDAGSGPESGRQLGESPQG